jgi:hypothetical protein
MGGDSGAFAPRTHVRLLANAVLAIHLGFVAFVSFGAFLVLRWPVLGWIHLPLAAWAVMSQFGSWPCPLTPLEKYLRERGGEKAYSGGFIDHYLAPTFCPAGMTRGRQLAIATILLVVNGTVYALLLTGLR